MKLPDDPPQDIAPAPPLKAETPSQIGDVVGIDRMDAIDRKKLDPRVKIQLLFAEASATYSRDPRGGGMAIVGRPRVILQLMLDSKIGPFGSSELKLERAIKFGLEDADIVGHWQDVPVIVRCTVRDDKLYCLPIDRIPQSQNIDRRKAGELRLHAHGGTLERLREN